MQKITIPIFTVLFSLAACGDDAGSGDVSSATYTETGVSSAADAETGVSSAEDSGDGGCTPGTPYCDCFDGMCFEGLTCNQDDYCIPEDSCTPGTLLCECIGTGSCNEGLTPSVPEAECICIDPPDQDECVFQTDCPYGEVCYEGEQTWCGSLELISWQVSIADWDISCYDGVGSCEYLFYRSRWDWDLDAWVADFFTNIQNPAPYDMLKVVAWESDAFSDDYLNTFEFGIAEGIEAWKNDLVLVAPGDAGTDTIDLWFQPVG